VLGVASPPSQKESEDATFGKTSSPIRHAHVNSVSPNFLSGPQVYGNLHQPLENP